VKRNRGYYVGTAIEGKWWRRYTKAPFFARGNGEYWYDEESFCFQRHLIQEPIVIPFQIVSAVEVGRWHCGRWVWGTPIVKLIWKKDGHLLSSGFVLSRSKSRAMQILEDLHRRLPQVSRRE
jgi:hypothetical protein